ncbi:MAG: iron ABC transporter permease [Candidatus Rokubacteria bacterium]|nr:iron ABC transporter permease [Candidatus Rokubacteria bacterium]
MITPLRLAGVLSGVGAVAIVSVLAALAVGPARLGPREVAGAVFGTAQDQMSTTIVLGLRLPRIMLAALAGAGLAVAGAGFQAITRNPLADPSLLGVSSGAAFGVVVAQVLGLGPTPLGFVGLTGFAFVGATVAALAVYLVARVGALLPVQTLLLAGVIVGLFFSSAITLMISLVDVMRLGAILHWLMGNLGPVSYGALRFLAIGLAVGIGVVLTQARALNLLAAGEESALQLGVEAERVKRVIFIAASFVTALVVSFAGPIGFVGLIIPHAVRMLLGADNRLLIPTSVLAGAAFLVLADALSRAVIQPSELPVGVITAFCGAPFFIYLLRTRYRRTL